MKMLNMLLGDSSQIDPWVSSSVHPSQFIQSVGEVGEIAGYNQNDHCYNQIY